MKFRLFDPITDRTVDTMQRSFHARETVISPMRWLMVATAFAENRDLRRLELVDERQERIAKNETVFRAANREIEHAEQEAGGGADTLIEVLCECGQDGCSGLISLTFADYDGVHAQEDRFVVLRGHESADIERIVDDRASFLVVDKFGEAEEIAEGESS